MNMAKQNFNIASSLIGLLLLTSGSIVTALDTTDQVVIEIGKNTVSLAEFDQTFDVAIRMLAAQQGISFVNQKPEQIETLRKQFLGQRASEMAMVQEATRRHISVSDEDIQSQFTDYLGKIRADTSTDNDVDTTVLKQLLREKRQVMLLTEQLLGEIEVRPGEVVVLHHDVQERLATPEQICLRHIVVADQDKANTLLAELNQGVDFAALARQHSTEAKSAANGGDIGCFAREHIVPKSDFERAAYNSKVGVLAGPVSSGFGYHLLIVYERKRARVPTLNEVYDDLEREIRHERLPNKLLEIRDASGIVTYPDRLDG